MPHDNLQEPLQSSPSILDDGVVEPVDVDLPRQRRDADPRRLPLEQVTEDFEVGIAPANLGAAKLEGGDVGRESDEVGGVARRGRCGRLVGLRVGDLPVLTTSAIRAWQSPGRGGGVAAGVLRFRGSFRGRRRSLRSSGCVGCSPYLRNRWGASIALAVALACVGFLEVVTTHPLGGARFAAYCPTEAVDLFGG